jgi:hypothetical protein
LNGTSKDFRCGGAEGHFTILALEQAFVNSQNAYSESAYKTKKNRIESGYALKKIGVESLKKIRKVLFRG